MTKEINQKKKERRAQRVKILKMTGMDSRKTVPEKSLRGRQRKQKMC